jgi:drug/metabolite transporter (DMT)-like permease
VSWIELALGSSLLLGVYEITRKHAVTRGPAPAVLLAASAGGLACVALLLGAARLWPSIGHGLGLELVRFDAREHAAVLAKAALVSASWLCVYLGVKDLPLSVSAPLRSMSPALTLLGAVLLLGERPSASQAAGIAVMLAGYLGMAWLGRAEGIHFTASRPVGWMILGTALGAASSLYDKHLLQALRLHPTTLQLWFCVYAVAVQAALAYALWWRRSGRAALRFRWHIPAVGALLVLSDQLYFRALAEPGALVSAVALVRRSSVVVSFAIGGLLLGERLLGRKAVFLGVILAGLGLLLY